LKIEEYLETLPENLLSGEDVQLPEKSFREIFKFVDLIKDELSLSVRAANTISLLDDVTQDPNMPSYVRTQLWQAVSKLESIRE